MAVSHLCEDCLPEGSSLGSFAFLDLKAGKPRHCRRRNDRVMRGVMGGFRCSCWCCREDQQ